MTRSGCQCMSAGGGGARGQGGGRDGQIMRVESKSARQPKLPVGWLVGWWIGWLVGWLIGWLVSEQQSQPVFFAGWPHPPPTHSLPNIHPATHPAPPSHAHLRADTPPPPPQPLNPKTTQTLKP